MFWKRKGSALLTGRLDIDNKLTGCPCPSSVLSEIKYLTAEYRSIDIHRDQMCQETNVVQLH